MFKHIFIIFPFNGNFVHPEISIFFLVFINLVVFSLSGCGINNTDIAFQSDIFPGESKSFGSGVVTSIIESDENDTPLAVGVVFTSAALTNSDTANSSVKLRMPQTVASTQFDHIEVEWKPGGQSPAGIYDVPRFSFLFFIISEAERNKISGVGIDSVKMYLQPDPKFIPEDYKLLPLSGSAKKGTMFYDSTAKEFNGGIFDKTLIYRYYNGKLIALEIMIAKSFFETHRTFIGNVKQPEKFQLPGFYPLKYNIKFTGSQNKFTVSLINLKRH